MEAQNTTPSPGSAEAGARLAGWIDKLLKMAYEAGERVIGIRLSATDSLALVHHGEQAGSLKHFETEAPPGAAHGVNFVGLAHPITKAFVPILGGVTVQQGEVCLAFAPQGEAVVIDMREG